jgi:hypothetical protein
MKYFMVIDGYTWEHQVIVRSTMRTYTHCVVVHHHGIVIWKSWATSLERAEVRTKGWRDICYHIEILDAHPITRKQYRDQIETKRDHGKAHLDRGAGSPAPET